MKASKGTFIDLFVGTGKSGGTVILPNLVGLTFETAQMVASESKLHISVAIYDETVTNRADSLNARIWKQYPSSEDTKQVNINSSVDVWLSVDIAKIFPDTPSESVETDDDDESFF
ncbi:MAG: hypothetical protein FWG22_04675 [Prolixibacteraceae bacterium]|nr:hypothetical protein [Prolixibacteraceae bacterium]